MSVNSVCGVRYGGAHKVILLAVTLMLGRPAFASEAIAACRSLDDDAARLKCYDEAAADLQADTSTGNSESGSGEARAEDLFGKSVRLGSPLDSIESRIEEVAESPLGAKILTLANGQVWAENEPSRRAIEPDQDIVITKQRWRYVMRLASGRLVAVDRIE